MKFSPQQDAALKSVSDWLRDPRGRQWFYLAGYAGTGKTTLAKHFAEGMSGNVLFAAYTGKAALVLRNKGCPEASTVHSLIYKLVSAPDEPPRFDLNAHSALRGARLLIVDEVSMVGEDLAKDLLSFGTRILVLGDPAQLPPVKATGFFTGDEPYFMLTEIHRQAADNPIIKLATYVREGGRSLSPGSHGESRIIRRSTLSTEDMLTADQVIVGLNRTRRSYNDIFRRLLDKDPQGPALGDRLVCLRNNREKGFLNGGIWDVSKVIQTSNMTADEIPFDPVENHVFLAKSVDTGAVAQCNVNWRFFMGLENDLDWRVRRRSDEFDYGYALTCHKAQGSQWDNVVVMNESGAFREDATSWLYTAITRAAERITIVVD